MENFKKRGFLVHFDTSQVMYNAFQNPASLDIRFHFLLGLYILDTTQTNLSKSNRTVTKEM